MLRNDWKEVLTYWSYGEWDVIKEHLADLDAAKLAWCPGKKNLFRALELTPYAKTKVMFIGQDPYPNPLHATGVAFSIPADFKPHQFPPTLKAILKEYEDDLHYPPPESGSLERWCEEGVLLWNAIPSCNAGTVGSHYGWPEWKLLTEEIVTKLSEKGIVYVFLGSKAREYEKYITGSGLNRVIHTAHPSPRAALNKELKNPFQGSRIFTRVNDYLNELALGPVNWRL